MRVERRGRSLGSAAVALLLALGTAACGSAVSPASDPAVARPVLSPARPAGQVTMTFSPEAQTYIAANPAFTHADLLAKVRTTLQAETLLVSASTSGAPTVSIRITEAFLRSTAAAAMFGALAGNDRITGEVSVTGADGAVLQRFNVTASYAWGGVAAAHETRTGWLYEAFANRVAEGLRGPK